jgi:phosphatidylserine decarboxylase
MAKSLRDWVDSDVKEVINKPLDWLSTHHFFRDPSRSLYSDSDFFFSPADGIILYQKQVKPEEEIINVKGKNYSLRNVMQDDTYDQESLVIGIFMTMYDVHVNRIPYPGTLYYKEVEPISSHNHPMLELENDLIDQKLINHENSGFLHRNQRVINKVYASSLGLSYYIVQIADYDVDCITPFQLGQGNPCSQNQRFSMIRYGSQVELVVPATEDFAFELIQDTGVHVEAGVDPLIRIHENFDDDEGDGEDAVSEEPGEIRE